MTTPIRYVVHANGEGSVFTPGCERMYIGDDGFESLEGLLRAAAPQHHEGLTAAWKERFGANGRPVRGGAAEPAADARAADGERCHD
ncbi:hypothetical protein [Luteimonas sp. e5]